MKVSIAIVNSSSFGQVFPEHLIALEKFAEVKIIKVSKEIKSVEFIPILREFDGIIASTNPNYPAELLEQLPKLKIIARHGIGYNNIDIAAAQKQGIIVTKVAGPVERNSVAEHAVGLLISAARWIPQGDRATHNNNWSKRANYIGTEITGKTIGIIGLGNIGKRAAEILHRGFDAQVLVYDPNIANTEIQALGYHPTSLNDLYQQSDFISLHCSHNEFTHHLINEEACHLMKAGVIISNAARGELVEDAAIIKHLKNGKIKVYATDVVEGEPIDSAHPLLSLENVIITPHLGGYSDLSSKGMGETMVNNLKAVFVDQRVPVESFVPGLNLNHIR